ncbi:MAG: 16S rRNA (guanine(527)-N(7))-methyltransferase RsmG [Armatimonadetes bacterium]|nr:16S rRNA (guanine(527)-N(7))-methyltransferase RsmG [Armatimonadota bacterium]
MDGKALAQAARAYGVQLRRTQLEAFTLFEKRLYEANRVANLTKVPQNECWSRHFLDSLILAPLIPKNATVLDIGSGPGFPGACLAIARSDLTVTCLDSAAKAVDFMLRLFGPGGTLPVLFHIVQGRAEDAAHDAALRESFDFVTGRAIAPFPVQCELSAAFARVGGLFVPMRTPKERDEIQKFNCKGLGLRLVDLKPVRVAGGVVRLLPVIRKQGRTPAGFPRRWARMKSQPIGTTL